MNALSKVFGWIGKVPLFLAIVQGAVIVGMQAWLDYGWLGVVVVVALAMPLGWLIPIVGWFFLPAAQMAWLDFFVAVFLLSLWASAATSRPD